MSLLERIRRSLRSPARKSEDHKYIYQKNGGYMVTKSIDGEVKYFGWYRDIYEAKKARDKFMANGWKKPDEPQRKNKYQYIYEVKKTGKWKVIRSRAGKNVYYGTYESLDEAIDARERIASADWLLDPDQYINYTNGSYVVSRNFPDIGREYYGTYDELDDARQRVVDLARGDWKSHDDSK